MTKAAVVDNGRFWSLAALATVALTVVPVCLLVIRG